MLDVLRRGYFLKLGRPFLGRYMKMGQDRTRDGWGVQKGPKKWDVLYGRSLINLTFYHSKLLEFDISFTLSRNFYRNVRSVLHLDLATTSSLTMPGGKQKQKLHISEIFEFLKLGQT